MLACFAYWKVKSVATVTLKQSTLGADSTVSGCPFQSAVVQGNKERFLHSVLVLTWSVFYGDV